MATFQLKKQRLLQVGLTGDRVMARVGAMVAYDGNVKFEKAVLGGEGLLGALKRKVTNESFELMTTSGTGTVYFARNAAEILLLPLQGEKIWVESNSVLAFDAGLKTNTVFAGLRGAATGQGLFTTTIEGTGHVAILSHGTPISLEVSQQYPLCVDPDAFLGYRGNIQQQFIFDVNWKSFVGQGSGESFQLKFTGMGEVFIQPNERK